MTRLRSRARPGLTLVELLVVLFICLFLVSMLIACNSRARVHSTRVTCASNLRQIGQAILLYSNENKGKYPKTRATEGMMVTPIWGTGVTASNPFAEDGPQPNDVSACLFLLLRTQDITAEVFTCPNSNAETDIFGGGTALNRSNFTNIRKNLSYSYQNPFISDGAIPSVAAMLQTCGGPSAELAIAADINPGITGDGKNVLAVTSITAKDIKPANSVNHDGDGQNVLYGDGHVEWQSSPFVGVKGDNIYTVSDGQGGYAPTLLASPFDANDSVLLPTDD